MTDAEEDQPFAVHLSNESNLSVYQCAYVHIDTGAKMPFSTCDY